VYVLSRAIILDGFTEIENDAVEENVGRAEEALDQEIAAINSTTGDWAYWDDTYQFVQDGNSDYIDANLAPDAFETLGVNIMLFTDPGGRVVFGRSVDLETLEEVPVTAGSLDAILDAEALFQFEDDLGSSEGILNTPDGTLMLASRAILPSTRDDVPAGTLIMARFLDDAQVESLREITHLDLTVAPAAPGDVAGAVSVETQGSDLIEGTSTITDVTGAPALTLTVDMPREIYSHGQTTVWYMVGALMISGLAFAIVMLLLLEKAVLSRLAVLSSRVQSISRSFDRSVRLPAAGGDEIGQLSDQVNQMLDSIEDLNRSLEDKVRERTRELELANAELRDRNRQLLDARTQAATDALTGLPNHRSFQEAARRAVEDCNGRPVSLVMLDLDGFKEINDTQGHQFGDEVLRRCAATLKLSARPAEAFRYGGDEFAVIAAGMSAPEGEALAERIRQAVQQDAREWNVNVTVSLGVAAYPESAGSAEELIYEADAAMYAAKRNGKNRACRWDASAPRPIGRLTAAENLA
jgi:diguanylate cyclase (GGDEF)-like protein